jgi:exonuclease SbcD
MKFIHFADVHLGMENYGKIDPKTGLNTRLLDFLNALEQIVQTAILEKVDLALFAGDAYKTRDPNPTYQKIFAQKIFELASNKIPVVMVVGNHDFPNALGKANTLEIFSTLKVPNVYLSGKPEIITVPTKDGSVQIATLPWIGKSVVLAQIKTKNAEDQNRYWSEKIGQIINELSGKINPSLPAILLAHASIEGAVYGSERLITLTSEPVIPIKSITKCNFDYGAFGHLHHWQEIVKSPPMVYSGSIERVDFGEEKEEKGFILGEIKKDNHRKITQYNFQPINTRKMLTIKINIDQDDSDPNEKIIKTINQHDTKDTIVKLIINCYEQNQGLISESKLYQALQNAYFIAGITKEFTRHGQQATIEGYSDQMQTLTELDWLKEYFKNKKYSSGKIEKLTRFAEEIMEENNDPP